MRSAVFPLFSKKGGRRYFYRPPVQVAKKAASRRDRGERKRAGRRAVSPSLPMIACCGRRRDSFGMPSAGAGQLASPSSSMWTPQRVHKRASEAAVPLPYPASCRQGCPYPALAHHHGIGAPAAAGRAAEPQPFSGSRRPSVKRRGSFLPLHLPGKRFVLFGQVEQRVPGLLVCVVGKASVVLGTF